MNSLHYLTVVATCEQSTIPDSGCVEVIKSVVTQTPHCEIKRVFLNRLTNSRHLHTAEEQNRMTNKQLSDRMSHA